VLEKLANEVTKLTPASREILQQLLEELVTLDAGVATYDAQLAQAHPVWQWLMTIPGLGELTATGSGGSGERCLSVQTWEPVCRLAGGGPTAT
jgi:hypothetical protein